MKVTPLVGRFVPFSNSVCTAAGQVIVQCWDVEERREHIAPFLVTLLISN